MQAHNPSVPVHHRNGVRSSYATGAITMAHSSRDRQDVLAIFAKATKIRS